jgi:hypothetical protein
MFVSERKLNHGDRAPFGIAEDKHSGISFSNTQCLYLEATLQMGTTTRTVQLSVNMQKALTQKSLNFVKMLRSGSIVMRVVSLSSAQLF